MNRILPLLFILIFSLGGLSIDNPQVSARAYHRSVLCEEGTASWCTPCVEAGNMLYSIYESGDYPFYYVAMVADKQTDASHRLYSDYNIAGFPTLFFDGGYNVKFGSSSNENIYRDAIEDCLERTDLPDLDMSMTVLWMDDGTINITVEIQNNDNNIYQGYLRTYVTEITSRWMMKNGEPYHFAFLDYAINDNISIASKHTYSETVQWNGTQEGYSDIRYDNIMVMATVFNGEIQSGYASPPSGNPFDAYYADYTVASMPQLDSPPGIEIVSGPKGITGFTRVGFEWRGQDDRTPVEDILYSYKLDIPGDGGVWSTWTSVNRVTYENLDDGDYLFQVRAKDKKNQISLIPAERAFRVYTGPPSIRETHPINGEENAPVYTDISIFFVYEMNKTSVENSLDIEPPVSYVVGWESNTLLIKPTENLDYLTAYQVTVGKDAKRVSGQSFEISYSFSFITTSLDSTSPSIIATYPPNGSQNVSITSSITLFFSEPMDVLSVKRALNMDPWFSHQQRWENNDTELVLFPLSLDEKEYVITVLDTATDKAGNNLTSDFVMYFKVRRPHVLYTLPVDGAQDVPISTDISIVFSQKMNASSVQEMLTIVPQVNFTLVQNGSITMIYMSDLTYDTDYILVIGGDAAASDGSTLGDDYILMFRTEKEEDEEEDAAPSLLPSFMASMTIGGFCTVFILLKKKFRKEGKKG